MSEFHRATANTPQCRRPSSAAMLAKGWEREQRVEPDSTKWFRGVESDEPIDLAIVRPEYRFPAGVFLPEDETRVRWLRPEEELLVLDTMRSPFRQIAKLAALTLMRLSEIRLLRREMVRLEQGVVMLPRAKAGARPVILSGEAQRILRGQLASHEREWVFPGPDGSPYDRSYVGRVFRKAARAAGLKDFHFHDLRHHGATMALNKGFTAPIVMALGGWKTERMMRRYAAVTDQTLRAAAEAVAGNEGVRPIILSGAASGS
jgi:integrase